MARANAVWSPPEWSARLLDPPHDLSILGYGPEIGWDDEARAWVVCLGAAVEGAFGTRGAAALARQEWLLW
jgi:hypothetical protein